MKKEIKEYIQNWRLIDGIKPRNEKVFIDGFIWLLNNLDDDREIEFNGEGSYFGKEITIDVDSYYGRGDYDLKFEVAYSKDSVIVYTGNHNGFWVPEYLSLNLGDERFDEVYSSLIVKLTEVFGLN